MKKLALLMLTNHKFRIGSMFKIFSLMIVSILGLYIVGSANIFANFYVYPKDGQSPDQLNRDKFECHEWAKQQTGVDPMSLSTLPSQSSGGEKKRGGLFKGALGGAALGAIGGAIAGNAGMGAAIGAGTGGLFGNRRQKKAEQEQARAQAEANHHKKLLIEDFNKAYKACLMGRGYSVN